MFGLEDVRFWWFQKCTELSLINRWKRFLPSQIGFSFMGVLFIRYIFFVFNKQSLSSHNLHAVMKLLSLVIHIQWVIQKLIISIVQRKKKQKNHSKIGFQVRYNSIIRKLLKLFFSLLSFCSENHQSMN